MRVSRALPALTLVAAGVLTLMTPGQAGATESPFYAKLGYTQLKVDIQSIGADSDGDFGWGLGGRMRVSGNHEARLEYNRPYDDKGTTIDAWSMAYACRF